MEAGKLFVGGISWETNEERLREYFQVYGEVMEAVILRDRATGRSRGFGFIVFSDASAAERVVKEKHVIDGRTVEAKKAVPRDDHQNSNRSNISIHGSPGPVQTKKIFVGGLASTVTESDFKVYFERFGTITDVVVMYDHNTQRPRGFGFITYDSEEAVDKVLIKTFHELNGKMVEVKRAVPKELSPGPTRSPSSGNSYSYSPNRVSSFLNSSQGSGLNSLGGYGMRMDSRFSPGAIGRSGHPSYNLSPGPNLESGFGLNYGLVGDLSFETNSYFSGNSRRIDNPFSYGANSSLFSTTSRNLWELDNPNYGANSFTANGFGASRPRNTGRIGSFGDSGDIWGISENGGAGNSIYGRGDNVIGNGGSYHRNNGGTSGASSLYTSTNHACDGGIGNLYGNDSLYSGHAFTSFGYGNNSATADVVSDRSVGYSRNDSVIARPDKGIAA